MALDSKTSVRLLVDERSKLIAYIWAIVRNAYQAEDLFQDVIVAVMEYDGEIRDADHLRSWARQTARFRAIDLMRRGRREHHMLSEKVIGQLETHWDSLNDVDAKETFDALSHCLRELAPDARRLVEMRYVNELTGRQIADQLGRKRQSVYMAMSRTYKALAACISRRTEGAAGE